MPSLAGCFPVILGIGRLTPASASRKPATERLGTPGPDLARANNEERPLRPDGLVAVRGCVHVAWGSFRRGESVGEGRLPRGMLRLGDRKVGGTRVSLGRMEAVR